MGSRKKPEFLRIASRQQLKSSKNPRQHPKRRGEGIDGKQEELMKQALQLGENRQDQER